jgi:hypothetical protein
MTCEEFLRRLGQGESVAVGDAAAHAAACPACARALARRNAVANELSVMADEPAPPFLHARIMVRVRTGRRVHAARWRLAFATAATVALAVGTYFVLRPGPVLAPTQLAERPITAPGHDHAQSHTDVLERQAAAVGDVRAPAPLAKRRADMAVPAQAARRTAPSAGTVAQAPAATGPASGETGAEHAAAEKKAQAAHEERVAGAALATQVAAPVVPDESKPTTTAEHVGADKLRLAPANAPRQAATASDSRQSPQQAKAAQTRAESKVAAGDTTVCTIRTTAGQVVAHLALPTGSAPPANVVWTLVVGRDGALAVHDARDRAVALDGTRLAAALGPVRLPPGRYTLFAER